MCCILSYFYCPFVPSTVRKLLILKSLFSVLLDRAKLPFMKNQCSKNSNLTTHLLTEEVSCGAELTDQSDKLLFSVDLMF